MTIYRGPGGTGSATSDADTTLYQEFLNQTLAARDAALQAETNAETAEANAEAAEAGVAASAAAAASSASAAASSASSASTSATNAASSASSASTSASNAASSASSASSSASSASTSATNAASSATAAASSASAASTSATNAANSATSASNSASTATTQATNAASSATAAASSATAAQSARTAAEAARDAALSAYDNFDDRYLGPKASDPTLDNDGNALVTGALYFNTATNVMKVYDGSTWVAAYVSAAGVLLAVNNLSDLSNTATARANLNVPTRTGGDASGTWGIDISGNAATATTATNVSGGTASVTSVSNSGNLTFTGTGKRITGDFSNATVANRVMFQSSTVNGNTVVGAIPNGTGAASVFTVFSKSDTANSSLGQLRIDDGVAVKIASTNAGGTGATLPIGFDLGGVERMRIDTSGNVGIGTSSPGAKLQVTASSTDTAAYYNGARQVIQNSSATTNNFDTLSFATANGNDAAAIWTIIGSHTTSAATGTLVFGTTNASSAATERMRIDSSGNLLVARTTNTGATARIALNVNTIGIGSETSSTGTIFHTIYYNPNGGVGGITTNGSSTAYNTSSDYRLKENIQPMTGALARVAALKPVTYKWKADGSDGEGFIAHELAEVVPQCVTGEKDAVDADGNPKYQGIDTSFLVATLTAAIQEQQAIIDAQQAALNQLTARIEALEQA